MRPCFWPNVGLLEQLDHVAADANKALGENG